MSYDDYKQMRIEFYQDRLFGFTKQELERVLQIVERNEKDE